MPAGWTSITNAQVAAGAPLTTALVTALRDNPQAQFEAAVGAPRLQPRAMNICSGILKPTGSATTYTIAGLDDWDLIRWDGTIEVTTNLTNGQAYNFNIYLGISDDGGATVASEILLQNRTGTATFSNQSFAVINDVFFVGLRSGLFFQTSNPVNGNAALSVPTGTPDALRFRTDFGNFGTGGNGHMLLGLGEYS